MEYYKSLHDTADSNARYYYLQTTLSPPDPNTHPPTYTPPMIHYKRYRLGDARTFATWFHPDKASILSLLDHFQAHTGKFAIPGYPRKLGFLLHGPPGTGKTTFIKALAQHTNRSVVSIPLARVRTNQQLMDIVLDPSFKVPSPLAPFLPPKPPRPARHFNFLLCLLV